MPDIAMCPLTEDKEKTVGVCPNKEKCLRHTASGTKPGYFQSWSDWWTSWLDGEAKDCPGFIYNDKVRNMKNTYTIRELDELFARMGTAGLLYNDNSTVDEIIDSITDELTKLDYEITFQLASYREKLDFISDELSELQRVIENVEIQNEDGSLDHDLETLDHFFGYLEDLYEETEALVEHLETSVSVPASEFNTLNN